MMQLNGQTAIITGAGSGIGRATAIRFARAGARIVVAELDSAAAKETISLLSAEHSESLYVQTDVTETHSVRDLFQAVDRAGWTVDCLINNAGAAEPTLLSTAEVSDQRWDAMIQVHLNGTFYCIRECLQRMLPRQQGTIINLGSVAGLNGLPGSAAYSAAKGGVIAMTKALSQEVAPRGIRVNCIAPGWINTPMLNYLPEKWRPGMLSHTPLARLGEPEEVANLALFLASDTSSFITGQVLSPNGGMFRW